MTRLWPPLQTSLFVGLVLAASALTLQRTPLPVAPLDAGLLDGRRARALEQQYDQAFAARRFGVSLWAALDYAVFREGRPGVIVGRDGWLYSDEEFRVGADSEQQLRRNLARVSEVRNALARVSEVRNALARDNVRLLVAVLPSKARVYPEHRRDRAPAKLQQDLYRRIHERLQAEGISAPDLLAVLTESKDHQPSFLRSDTHWTPWGAQHVAQRLATAAQSALRLQTPVQPHVTRQRGTQTVRGDLLNFLPLEPWFAFLLPAPETLPQYHTEAVSLGAVSGLLDDAPAAAVALVGSSYSADARWNFAGALREALMADVANYAREGVGPFRPMQDYLASVDFRRAPPRLVIWELPERYFLQPDEPITPPPSKDVHS